MRTEFENMIANGVDEDARRIFFGAYLPPADAETSTDFTKTSVEYAVRAIHRMAASSKKPIEIHMDSFGGDTYATLYLVDVIETCPVQIKFFGGGAIFSAASWIMSVCDERYLYPNATVMIHKCSYGIDGPLTEHLIENSEAVRLQSVLEDILARNSRMPKEFWTEVLKRNLYLTAEESILLGIADKIVEPQKRGNFRKTRSAGLASSPNSSKLNKLMRKIKERTQGAVSIELTLNTPKVEEVDEKLTTEGVNDGITRTEGDAGARTTGSGNQDGQ